MKTNKRYITLRDLPLIKKGSIFEFDRVVDEVITHYRASIGEGENSYPLALGLLEEQKDWFRLLNESECEHFHVKDENINCCVKCGEHKPKIEKLETDMGKFPNDIPVLETANTYKILENRKKINELIDHLNKKE